MITSYSDLQSVAITLSHRTDLTSILPDLIVLAESRIYRDVRAHEMETSYSGTIASGVIAVPTGFLGWKSIYVDANPAQHLQTKTLSWFYQT